MKLTIFILLLTVGLNAQEFSGCNCDRLYPHCWGRFVDSSQTISVTQNNWARITNEGGSLFVVLEQTKNMIFRNDTIIVPRKAHYNINSSFTISGTPNDVYEIRIMSNTGEIVKNTASTNGVGYNVPIPLGAYWNADIGAKMWFEIRNIISGDDPVVKSGIVTVSYYHKL